MARPAMQLVRTSCGIQRCPWPPRLRRLEVPRALRLQSWGSLPTTAKMVHTLLHETHLQGPGSRHRGKLRLKPRLRFSTTRQASSCQRWHHLPRFTLRSRLWRCNQSRTCRMVFHPQAGPNCHPRRATQCSLVARALVGGAVGVGQRAWQSVALARVAVAAEAVASLPCQLLL